MMKKFFSDWLNKKYPQNILIRKPLIGTLFFLIFCIFFVIIYKPLDVHESRFLNMEMTVAVYFIIASFPLFGIVKLLKKTRYFSDPEEWTILKELFSILISLFGTGVTIYFSGFLLEVPDSRWNLPTFFNSVITGFLIGLVPFLFFTIINYRYLFVTDIVKSYHSNPGNLRTEMTEEKIRIVSQLKKEELEFYPGQLLYAESDGNYLVFHLNIDNQIKKKVIRNSISNIEQQLSAIPFFFRTHRAFIVNVKKIIAQKGNTLGYKIKLSGIDAEIPVSRQKAREFDRIMKQYE
jgi:hypothetical protein